MSLPGLTAGNRAPVRESEDWESARFRCHTSHTGEDEPSRGWLRFIPSDVANVGISRRTGLMEGRNVVAHLERKRPQTYSSLLSRVLLLPVLGKRWHALLRSRYPMPFNIDHRCSLADFLDNSLDSLPSLCVDTLHGLKWLSDACLFLDLRSAFHHLIRHLAMNMGDEGFPEVLSDTLEKDGYHTSELQNSSAHQDRLGPLPLPDSWKTPSWKRLLRLQAFLPPSSAGLIMWLSQFARLPRKCWLG